MSSISENPVGLSAIGEGASSDALLDISPYAPLSISASDTVVYREAIRLNVTDPLDLQIQASDVLGRKVVYDDTGVLQVQDNNVEYKWPALGPDALNNSSGDLGPISVNPISTLQFDGGTNYFPSILTLSVDAQDNTIKAVSRETLGALEIAATDNDDGSEGVLRQDGRREYPWFRPVVAFDIDNASFKSIAASSVDYLFVGPDGLEQNGFTPVGVISSESITEHGTFPGTASISTFVETAPLEISAQSVAVLETAFLEFDDVSTGVLEVSATDTVNAVVTVSDTGTLEVNITDIESVTVATTDTAGLEVAADAIIGKTFVYDDTAVLGKASATSIEVTSGTVDTTALVIGVDSVVNKTFVYEDSTALEVGATADNTLSVDSVDTVALTVEADSVDIVSFDPAEGNAELQIGVTAFGPDVISEPFVLDNPNAYDQSESDLFGWDVAISGNRAIVGARLEDEAGGAEGSNSGKAYIFDVDSGSLVHTLDNPNAFHLSAGDDFGAIVAMSETHAIFGVPRERDEGGLESGKAYIFDVTNGSLLHTLDNPNPYGTSANDNFGYSVDISGNYAIVGTRREDRPAGNDSGKAYVFDVTSGSLLYTLDNPNAYSSATSDNFGGSVAISGNYAIVGAMNITGIIGEDDAGGVESGKAYIYDISTFTTSNISSANYVLDNPNAYGTSAGDAFGARVDISGNYAIVGAQHEDDASGSDSGKAYIYDISTFTTSTISSANYVLDNPNAYGTSASDNFGWDVAISGNRAIVGTYLEDDAGGTTSGKAYIYDISTFTTSTISSANHVLDNPNAFGTTADDRFGQSVDISGDYIIAGAPFEDQTPVVFDNGSLSGKAYIFELQKSGVSATLTNSDPAQLEINASSVQPTIVSAVDTTALEVAATDAVEQTFVFDDTGVFAKAGATSIETTSGSIDTTALIITGADAIANTFAYADSAVFVKLGVDETGNTFDIVDTTTVELGATDATEVVNTFDQQAALEISASSPESVSETSTGALEVAGQDSIEQTFEYTDTGVFAKAGATSIEVTSGTVDTTALIITGADAIANTFAYADSAVFVKLVATDEDIVYDIQDTTNLQVAADDVFERTFAVDDSADLETAASDTQRSSVSRVTQGALEVDANILLGITEASFAPLQIAGDEQLGKTFVYQDTGVFRTIDASSTEISYNRDFTGELEIAGQDSIEQLFAYDDVGVFRAVAAFDLDTVRSITDTTALEIAGSDTFSQTTSRITQGALEVAVDSPHTFAINRSSTAPLEIAEDGTISVAYDYADTGVFAKLAADETAFTTNRDAIGELEIAAQEAIVQIFNTEDVAALGALVVSDQQIVFVFDTVTANLFSVLSDQSSTQNFAADPALELSDTATNSIAYTQPQDTVETVIDSISVVNKTFAYDDTAEFGLLGASDSENIFNFEYVEFNTFGATDDVDVVYNFGSEAPALEAGDTATQSSTRQFADEVDFVTFVAASSEILVNIENEGILGFGVTDDVDIVYNFQPQAFIETTAFDDITQSVSRRSTAPLNVGSITNQYYYTKFKQIYANDTIEFKLKGDSNEMKITGAVADTGPKQTWIG